MFECPIRFCKRLYRKLLNFQGSFNIWLRRARGEFGVYVTRARFIALRQEVYPPKINKILVFFKQINLFRYLGVNKDSKRLGAKPLVNIKYRDQTIG